jgi:hypothetical protein
MSTDMSAEMSLAADPGMPFPAGPAGGIEVSAVMPCLNEERTLALCIRKAQAAFDTLGVRGEVIVADNGSTDRSVEIAETLGARVVIETVRGYGAALRAGIRAARGRVIVMGDSDDSYDWSAIEPFVRKISEGYDLVIGNRFRGGIEPGAMPPLHRYLGNPVLSVIARIAFRMKVGDVHCGMRAFTPAAFDAMQTTTTGMEFATEMIANAAHQRLRIGEIPTRLYPDKRDRPPHLRSFRDGWRHLRFMLTYAPDHLYLAPGLSMLVAGLAMQFALAAGPLQFGAAHFGLHYVALGGMLSLVGFNLLNLGVLAKTLMAQRYRGLTSRVVALLRRRFSVETGIIASAVIGLPGVVIDLVILARWLADPSRAMGETVHAAFVATTMVVLAANVAFSSFLLNMMLDAPETRD